MDAKRCDRCGAFYDTKYKWEYKVVKCDPHPDSIGISVVDLCHNCMYELEKWLKEKNNETD